MIIDTTKTQAERQLKPSLTNEQKEIIIGKAMLSDKGRKQLVDAMVEPVRCGGMEYKNGVGYIMLGGVQYPYTEFHAAHDRNGGKFPVEWMAGYRVGLT